MNDDYKIEFFQQEGDLHPDMVCSAWAAINGVFYAIGRVWCDGTTDYLTVIVGFEKECWEKIPDEVKNDMWVRLKEYTKLMTL